MARFSWNGFGQSCGSVFFQTSQALVIARRKNALLPAVWSRPVANDARTKAGCTDPGPTFVPEVSAASRFSRRLDLSLLRMVLNRTCVALLLRFLQPCTLTTTAQTAAHHLESMREARALGMGPGAGLGSVTEAGGGAESRCDELLQEGVAQLARRVQGEAAAVTELLEELRYEAEDLD